MSEFNYLTGRPELFDNAPADALVVLEHEDGRLFFAIAHDLGAKYWNEDGTPGSKVGLIALYKKTRVVASRARAGGLPQVEPKRDPIPKTRLDRIQQAQSGLKKAISQPAPAKPKPEPKPAPVKVEPPNVTPKKLAGRAVSQASFSPCAKCGVIGIHACPGAPVVWSEQDKQRLNEAVKQIVADEQKPKVEQVGFVSLFELAKATGKARGPAITLYRNGSLSFSANLFAVGDSVDVQVDAGRHLIRVGKVATGGRELKKTRIFPGARLLPIVGIPKDAKSQRIVLSQDGDWWVGTFEPAELAGRPA